MTRSRRKRSTHSNAHPASSIASVASVHVRAQRDRPSGLHHHIKRDRLVAWDLNLDAMRTGFEIQVLEDTVEVVDDSDVVAVREDVCLPRSVRDAQAAVQSPGNRIVVTTRRVHIWIRAAGA